MLGTIRKPRQKRGNGKGVGRTQPAIAVVGNEQDWADHLPLQLYLLGGFRVGSAGRVIPDAAWQRPSGKTLVKLLALEPSHRLHREQILEFLWPEHEPDAASRSLRKALHYARHALEPDPVSRTSFRAIVTRDETVALSSEAVWVDIDHFEKLARAALEGNGAMAYEAALAAYGGDLLPEDRYHDWAAGRREQLANLHLQLLDRLATELERRGAYGQAIGRLREIVRLEPAREEAHRRLMRHYGTIGNKHEALQQYQACCRVLEEELGVEPEPETQALLQELLSTQAEQPVLTPVLVERQASTPFFGREHALELLRAELARAEGGTGNLILVAGEAGVGKTRLVEEMASAAVRQAVLVLWGASYEAEGQAPYGPVVEALESYLTRLPLHARHELAEAHSALVSLLPSLQTTEAPPVDPVFSPRGARPLLFDAVEQLLLKLALRSPLLLVLDDLHTADVESFQLVQHLARRATGRRWLIIGTYREGEIAPGGAFQRFIAAASRNSSRRVHLLRLARPECDSLALAMLEGGTAGRDVLDQLYGLCLGNPLFLQELVVTLKERGGLILSDGAWRLAAPDVAVPRQVRELVEARVDRMDVDVRRVLALAATIGMEFSFTDLRDAAWAWGMSEDALLDALDRVLEARLVEERGEAYAFSHPLQREALYDRLSRQRRAQLHGLIARVIENRRPAAVEVLAYHYSRSRECAKAIEYLEQAGNRARTVYANDAAERYYRELLERLDGDTVRAAAVAEKLGAVLITVGRYDEALAFLDQAVAAYEQSDDLAALASAVAAMGQAYAARGLAAKGLERLEPFTQRLGILDSSLEPARLHASLARLFWTSGRYEESLAAAERVVALAQIHPAHPDQARLLGVGQVGCGVALFLLGRVDEARRALEAAIPLVEGAGDLEALYRGLNSLGVIHFIAGAFVDARRYREHALEIAQKMGDPAIEAFALTNLGSTHFVLGDWPEARLHIGRAMDITRGLGRCWVSAYPLRALGFLELLQGAEKEARRLLGDCIEIATEAQDLQALRYAERLLAEQDLLAGRFESARCRLAPLLDRPGLQEEDVTRLLPVLATAYLGLDDVCRATELVLHGVERALVENDRLALVELRRVQGTILTKRHQWAEAGAAFTEAVERARTMPFPYGEARALYEWGKLMAEQGEIDSALERLKGAREIFQRLGARPAAEQTERALASLQEKLKA